MRDFLLSAGQVFIIILAYNLLRPIPVLHFLALCLLVFFYGLISIYRYEYKR